ncbi:hypothetical protein [Streptomyces sp. NPDC001070]
MRVSVLVAGETDVRPLLDILQGLDVEEAWVLHNDLGDRFMLDPVPDCVVGVLTLEDLSQSAKGKPFSNADVGLRMGLAAGRGVPTLVIAPAPIQATSPDPLITTVTCSLDATDALTDHVWAFTAMLDLPVKKRVPASQGERLGDAAGYLAELDRLDWGSGSLGMKLERLVSRVLMATGAAVVEPEASSLGDRVDIAFLPSPDSPDIVLIELKTGHLQETQLEQAEEQLQKYVIDRQARYGLVLYHDLSGKPLKSRHPTPLIVRMSARQFIEKLASEPLPKVLDAAVVEAVGRI